MIFRGQLIRQLFREPFELLTLLGRGFFEEVLGLATQAIDLLLRRLVLVKALAKVAESFGELLECFVAHFRDWRQRLGQVLREFAGLAAG